MIHFHRWSRARYIRGVEQFDPDISSRIPVARFRVYESFCSKCGKVRIQRLKA